VLPDFERFARSPWPMACCASSGIRLLRSALAFSCAWWASLLRIKTSAQALEVLMSTMRSASMSGIGGSIPNRAGGPPLSTQRQNLRSAVLVERVGMGGDLDPFAAAGDDGQDR
jgi:hypothetical protein